MVLMAGRQAEDLRDLLDAIGQYCGKSTVSDADRAVLLSAFTGYLDILRKR